jgi:glucose/arabinose dehydrogenase
MKNQTLYLSIPALALAALTLAAGQIQADDEAASTPPAAAAAAGRNGASVTRWAEGLAAPQGIAVGRTGDVFVVENGSGRVLRFSRDGKRRGVSADGLRAPAFALLLGGTLYVSERDGNSVAVISGRGVVSRLPGEVTDPLGLAPHDGGLLVVSHRKSIVERWGRNKGGLARVDAPPFLTPPSGAKYGWRDIAAGKDGAVYVTDEVSGSVLRRAPAGELTEWAKGLSSPSGLAFSPGGALYVTEEGNGRISRLAPDGTVSVVAEGLGKARDAAFLDARTLLVTDRAGGNLWKVTLPR